MRIKKTREKKIQITVCLYEKIYKNDKKKNYKLIKLLH